jgi:hypothetical protein
VAGLSFLENLFICISADGCVQDSCASGSQISKLTVTVIGWEEMNASWEFKILERYRIWPLFLKKTESIWLGWFSVPIQHFLVKNGAPFNKLMVYVVN